MLGEELTNDVLAYIYVMRRRKQQTEDDIEDEGSKFSVGYAKPCLLGRSRNADIIIQLPNVLSEHCEIYYNPEIGKCCIKCFDANPGTSINNRPLEKDEPVELKSGDVIQIYNRALKFQYVKPHMLRSESRPTTPIATARSSMMSPKPVKTPVKKFVPPNSTFFKVEDPPERDRNSQINLKSPIKRDRMMSPQGMPFSTAQFKSPVRHGEQQYLAEQRISAHQQSGDLLSLTDKRDEMEADIATTNPAFLSPRIRKRPQISIASELQREKFNESPSPSIKTPTRQRRLSMPESHFARNEASLPSIFSPLQHSERERQVKSPMLSLRPSTEDTGMSLSPVSSMLRKSDYPQDGPSPFNSLKRQANFPNEEQNTDPFTMTSPTIKKRRTPSICSPKASDFMNNEGNEMVHEAALQLWADAFPTVQPDVTSNFKLTSPVARPQNSSLASPSARVSQSPKQTPKKKGITETFSKYSQLKSPYVPSVSSPLRISTSVVDSKSRLVTPGRVENRQHSQVFHDRYQEDFSSFPMTMYEPDILLTTPVREDDGSSSEEETEMAVEPEIKPHRSIANNLEQDLNKRRVSSPLQKEKFEIGDRHGTQIDHRQIKNAVKSNKASPTENFRLRIDEKRTSPAVKLLDNNSDANVNETIDDTVKIQYEIAVENAAADYMNESEMSKITRIDEAEDSELVHDASAEEAAITNENVADIMEEDGNQVKKDDEVYDPNEMIVEAKSNLEDALEPQQEIDFVEAKGANEKLVKHEDDEDAQLAEPKKVGKKGRAPAKRIAKTNQLKRTANILAENHVDDESVPPITETTSENTGMETNGNNQPIHLPGDVNNDDSQDDALEDAVESKSIPLRNTRRRKVSPNEGESANTQDVEETAVEPQKKQRKSASKTLDEPLNDATVKRNTRKGKFTVAEPVVDELKVDEARKELDRATDEDDVKETVETRPTKQKGSASKTLDEPAKRKSGKGKGQSAMTISETAVDDEKAEESHEEEETATDGDEVKETVPAPPIKQTPVKRNTRRGKGTVPETVIDAEKVEESHEEEEKATDGDEVKETVSAPPIKQTPVKRNTRRGKGTVSETVIDAEKVEESHEEEETATDGDEVKEPVPAPPIKQTPVRRNTRRGKGTVPETVIDAEKVEESHEEEETATDGDEVKETVSAPPIKQTPVKRNTRRGKGTVSETVIDAEKVEESHEEEEKATDEEGVKENVPVGVKRTPRGKKAQAAEVDVLSEDAPVASTPKRSTRSAKLKALEAQHTEELPSTTKRASRSKKVTLPEDIAEQEDATPVVKVTPKRATRSSRTKMLIDAEEEQEEIIEAPASKGRGSKAKKEHSAVEENLVIETTIAEKPKRVKKKTEPVIEDKPIVPKATRGRKAAANKEVNEDLDEVNSKTVRFQIETDEEVKEDKPKRTAKSKKVVATAAETPEVAAPKRPKAKKSETPVEEVIETPTAKPRMATRGSKRPREMSVETDEEKENGPGGRQMKKSRSSSVATKTTAAKKRTIKKDEPQLTETLASKTRSKKAEAVVEELPAAKIKGKKRAEIENIEPSENVAPSSRRKTKKEEDIVNTPVKATRARRSVKATLKE